MTQPGRELSVNGCPIRFPPQDSQHRLAFLQIALTAKRCGRAVPLIAVCLPIEWVLRALSDVCELCACTKKEGEKKKESLIHVVDPL